MDFIRAAEDEYYTAVLIDVVASDCVDGAPLEFPPAPFVDEVFLNKHVARITRPGGVVAMNAIGDVSCFKGRLLLCQIINFFSKFASYILSLQG